MMNPNCSIQFQLVALSVLSILLSFVPGQIEAEGKYERDLEKLKKFHKEAVERALEPVNNRYLRELETLLKRATFDGDLDTAILVREEMARINPAASNDAGFVGEWEYEENGKTYRRIILADGTAELWRNGEKWRKSAESFWWDGFTWRKSNKTIEIFADSGNKFYIWKLEGENTVIQEDLKSKKLSKFTRATKPWRK